VAINTINLTELMDVDPSRLKRDIATINPKASVLSISCRRNSGIAEIGRSLGLD